MPKIVGAGLAPTHPGGLQVEVGVAKVARYATRESGDSVEVIERPHGGLSVVMVDGQRSGKGAKAISNIVVRKAVSLVAEGVRDGAVARAVHDYLRTQRSGYVSAELTIISVDLETKTLVVSRNSACPVLFRQDEVWHTLDAPAERVGMVSRTRPAIEEVPLAAGQAVVAYTDGFPHAGSRRGLAADPGKMAVELLSQPGATSQQVADGLLAYALALDEGRPGDDITVVVLQLLERSDAEAPDIRRMAVSFPVPPV